MLDNLNTYIAPTLWENALNTCANLKTICNMSPIYETKDCIIKSIFSQILPSADERSMKEIIGAIDRTFIHDTSLSHLTNAQLVDYLIDKFNKEAQIDLQPAEIAEKISGSVRDFFSQIVCCYRPILEETTSCVCIIKEKAHALCSAVKPIVEMQTTKGIEDSVLLNFYYYYDIAQKVIGGLVLGLTLTIVIRKICSATLLQPRRKKNLANY